MIKKALLVLTLVWAVLSTVENALIRYLSQADTLEVYSAKSLPQEKLVGFVQGEEAMKRFLAQLDITPAGEFSGPMDGALVFKARGREILRMDFQSASGVLMYYFEGKIYASQPDSKNLKWLRHLMDSAAREVP